MKRLNDKQEIAQLLSKFMAGETSVADEQMLAQYFRTHEVGEEWTEYKEMFALFDSGEVDIELVADPSDGINSANSDKLPKKPKTVREKPKIVVFRWLVGGIAASVLLLLTLHFNNSNVESADKPMVAKKTVLPNESLPTVQETVISTGVTEKAIAAQATPIGHQSGKTISIKPRIRRTDTISAAESLAECIARLEAEMENLDDSINSAQVEKLIAADARLQQLVYRIVGKQTEQAMNELQKDSTANYINF